MPHSVMVFRSSELDLAYRLSVLKTSKQLANDDNNDAEILARLDEIRVEVLTFLEEVPLQPVGMPL